MKKSRTSSFLTSDLFELVKRAANLQHSHDVRMRRSCSLFRRQMMRAGRRDIVLRKLIIKIIESYPQVTVDGVGMLLKLVGVEREGNEQIAWLLDTGTIAVGSDLNLSVEKKL